MQNEIKLFCINFCAFFSGKLVIMKYRFSERESVRERWQRLLPEYNFSDMLDTLMSALFAHLVIDIVAFGYRTEYLYPEEYQNSSIEQIILHHYGKQAVELINDLLP